MDTSFYKCCAVPMCKSTSIRTPKKLFIHVPKNAQIRRKWLKLARRHPASLTPKSTSYFCEDHFDLQNDMENYVQYTTMGVVGRIRMRPGCLPTKFACQPMRAKTFTDDCRPAAAKRQRLVLINECEEEIKAATFQQSENLNIEVPNQDEDQQHEQQQKTTKIDKAVQINITAKFRSKTTQANTKSHTKQTSPIKLSSTSVSTSPFKVAELKPFVKPELFCSSVTCNLSNEDRSDSDVSSLYTPSVALMSKTSSDTSSLNVEFQKEANLKCMVDHTLDKIKKTPQFYIGIPKDCYFLIKIIHEHTGISESKILLCLKKIRLDSKFSELSDEFEISISYACKIFTENVSKIAEVMRPFIVNLDKASIKRCLPIAYRKNYYNVTCIIDCLEIEIQKPGKALHQALTWSEYKKTNTIKYLISSTPNGLVNYISQGYGGRISDVCLVENCGFLNSLPIGAHVMADRGFKHIETLLLGIQCKLIRPPSIVSGRLDDVIAIACGLINLQNSLINK
ncbi:unnamed protein product [Euphydryas editha]|uniref:THAP-type domain-containing protein n=1 Tax=Euphydryas editha TaxID=104508 RepID=A0AAU9U6P0_EUPED|nr:unnamed protein product [Euphydryas editha]